MENAPAPTDLTRPRPLALAALTAALLGLAVYVALPLLPAITWAAALAILAWPAQTWVAARTGRPALAALLLTLAAGAAIVGSGALVAYHLVKETAAAVGSAGPGGPSEVGEGGVREAATKVPGGPEAVGWLDRAGVDLDRQARDLAAQATAGAAGVAMGSARAALQLAVCLFLLFFLLKDRDTFVRGVRRALPLSGPEADRVMQRATDAVYGNLYANLGTSLVAGVTGGLVFWAVGLPAPALLGAAVFVLDLVPAAGTWLVWAPAAVYLGAGGNWGGAAAVVTYGVATAVLVDYLLYARLAAGRAGMHPAMALVGVVGGLAVFGVAGLVLGPVVLALAGTLLDVWHDRRAAAEGRAITV